MLLLSKAHGTLRMASLATSSLMRCIFAIRRISLCRSTRDDRQHESPHQSGNSFKPPCQRTAASLHLSAIIQKLVTRLQMRVYAQSKGWKNQSLQKNGAFVHYVFKLGLGCFSDLLQA